MLLGCLLRLQTLDQGRVADYCLGLQPLVLNAEQVKQALVLFIVEFCPKDVMRRVDSLDPVCEEDSVPA